MADGSRCLEGKFSSYAPPLWASMADLWKQGHNDKTTVQ